MLYETRDTFGIISSGMWVCGEWNDGVRSIYRPTSPLLLGPIVPGGDDLSVGAWFDTCHQWVTHVATWPGPVRRPAKIKLYLDNLHVYRFSAMELTKEPIARQMGCSIDFMQPLIALLYLSK